jgi:hypothetical protein
MSADAVVPTMVKMTEWVARYNPTTVSMAVLKAVTAVARFAWWQWVGCIRSS